MLKAIYDFSEHEDVVEVVEADVIEESPVDSNAPTVTKNGRKSPFLRRMIILTGANKLGMTEKKRKARREAVVAMMSKLDRKQTIAPYIVTIGTSSQVHGMKELFASTNCKSRFFWILVTTLCLCAATYEIYKLVDQYNNDRIATSIRLMPTDAMQYPKVLICPTRWVNLTRASHDYGLTYADMDYLYNLVDTHYQSSADNHVDDDNAFDGHQGADMINYRAAHENLLKIAKQKNLKSVSELMMEIGFGTSAVVCKCCDKIERWATLHGVCYKVQLCTAYYQITDLPTLIVPNQAKPTAQCNKFTTSCRQPLSENLLHGAYISVFDNQTSIGRRTHDHFYVDAANAVVVKLALTRHNRKATEYARCTQRKRSDVTESMATCECMDEYHNQPVRKCSVFAIFEGGSSLPQCAPMETIMNEDFRHKLQENRTLYEELLNCESKCLQPCFEYEYRVTNVFQHPASRQHIIARFDIPTFVVETRNDLETLTIDTLISSIGGQTGLWLGASVVSLFQLVSYICCPCLHWRDLGGNIRRGLERGKTIVSRRSREKQQSRRKSSIEVVVTDEHNLMPIHSIIRSVSDV